MSRKLSLKEKIEHALVDGTDEVIRDIHQVEDFVREKWHHRLHKKAKHHVHRLREKPDHHKQIVAFSVAFVVTAIVFVLWYFFSLPRIIDGYHVNMDQNQRLDLTVNPIEEIKNMDQQRRLDSVEGAQSLEIE